jgi:predicted HAD superfamily phosphohydrolase YqeG
MIKCVVFDIGNTIISKKGNNEVDPVLKSDIERLKKPYLKNY